VLWEFLRMMASSHHAMPLRAGTPTDHRQRGFTLLDVLVTCGLIVTLAAIAIPTLHAARERDAARMAARYLASRLNLLRIEALRRNTTVAMRFDPDVLGVISTYIDGDGDGVRQADIDHGVDIPLDPSMQLSDQFTLASLRIPLTIPAPDGSGSILAASDPVRIGSSNFLSFSAVGTATSGTIYLSSNAGSQLCVRVAGATARIRVLLFDRVTEEWREE
jgi:type II secretory pathway pseudopilin PulG